ncbi:MAG: 3-phosphoglycerate dehydrogenase, partial [Anaerovoracaceae bacterium]
EALSTGKIKNYVTDFPNEKVLNLEGVIALPHLGASTNEAEDNCASMAAEQLMDYIENGNILNSVNFPACSMGKISEDAKGRICILHKNIPAMLGKITGIMADLNINIRDLTNKSKGDFAYTLMDIDTNISEADLSPSLEVEGIIRVRVIG